MVFSDSGSPVDVVTGQDFVIRLVANPSTGYVWNVSVEPDQSVVTLVNAEGSYEAPDQSLPGASGFQLFDVVAVGPGSTQVQFTYARPFDPNDNPTIETFTIEVR